MRGRGRVAGARAQKCDGALRQSLADVVSLCDDAAPGAHGYGRVWRLPLLYRISSAAAPAQCAQISGGAGDRRRQLCQRYPAGGEGRRATSAANRALSRNEAGAMIRNAQTLLERIRAIHAEIRDEVLIATQQSSLEQLSAIVAEEGGDTIFAIDRVSEEVLLRHFEQLGQEWSFVLIAEGLGEDGRAVFPAGTSPEEAELRIIIDPIDGTRGLMYQKRPAWILTGVAPNRGEATSLADIEIAVQTEIPLLKQYLSDSFWAIEGSGARGERLDHFTGKREPLPPHPSQAQTIAQGYGSIARFFPGGRAELAAIDDEVIEQTLGPTRAGK